ncbi:MAG: hypothetical protein ACYC4H_09435 [Desulfocucumaceae bacterium]
MPWIVHWSIMGNPDLSMNFKMGIPLLAAAMVWLYRSAFARPTWMETGTPIYFTAAWLITQTGNGFFPAYRDAIDPLVLAGMWMGTLATSMPLTGHYSKWHFHPALWKHPIFIKTNSIITAAWAGIFLLQVITVLAGHFSPALSLHLIVIRHLLIIPGIIFTVWFQKWYPAYGSPTE